MSSTEWVERLSPDDLAVLEKVREEWLKSGLSTAPTDRAKAQAAAAEAYTAAGLKPPRINIWLQSPWAGNTVMKLLASDIDSPWELSTAQLDVWDAVWKQLLPQMEGLIGEGQWQDTRRRLRQEATRKISDRHGVIIEKQVKEMFAEGLGVAIWTYLRRFAGPQMYSRIRSTTEDKVKAAIEGKLSAIAAEQAYHELVYAVHQQIWSYIAEPLRQQVPFPAGVLGSAQKWENGYGQHDAGWLSYYDFVERIGVKGTEPLRGLQQLAKSCGWFWPYEKICVLTDRPVKLERDNRRRLHGETEMALGYGDKWGMYAWHGVLVPAYVVLLPEPLTFDLIEAETNVEVRRVLIERFGLEKYLREGSVGKIHEDQCGILYRMQSQGDEPIMVVRVKNSTPEPDGTIKEYFLRVPPTMLRARQAVAWTFGLTEEEYQPRVET
jgi:hypothetical protein